MEQDCRTKRAEFIDKAVKTRESFQFAHPEEVILATEKYCTNFYGSQLWMLRSETAEMIYASWRTNLKLIWNLPRNCKNYFIGSLLAPEVTPPRVSLLCRFHRFFRSLLDSPSKEIRMMACLSARDIRTSLGSNLSHIREETGLDPWLFGGTRMKNALLIASKSEIPIKEIWRVPLLEKYIHERTIAHYNGDTSTEDTLNNLIYSLVTS